MLRATMPASAEETAALLGRVPVFEELADDDLRRVAEVTVPRRFATSEVVFREGDDSDTCYVVSAGQDRLVPASAVRRVAALYPQASLRHYPDRGHWVLDDVDTDEMATEIANWLQGHEQRVAARGRE